MTENYQKLLFNVCDDDIKFAWEAHNITKKSHDECVEKLKDWIKFQPHFPETEINTRILERFLIRNGYNIEETKTKLDNYCTLRAQINEIFENRDVFHPEFEKVLHATHILMMPKMTEQRHRIIITGNYDCNIDHDPTEAYKFFFILYDLLYWWDLTSEDLVICDFSNIALSTVMKMSLVVFKKVLLLLEKSFIGRLKGLHIIKAPSYAQNLINITKMMLSKQLRERMYVHNTVEDIHKYISPEYLPKELGGLQKSYTEYTDLLTRAVKSDEVLEIIKYFDKIKSDKSKIPPATYQKLDDMLGISGSFKKLDFD